MDDAIYVPKSDILDLITEEYEAGGFTDYSNYSNLWDEVDDMPAADVQPIIHAHWIRGEEKGFRTYNPLWYCSNCGGQIRYDTRMRQYQKIKRPVWEVNAFCRKCGAKMEQE